MGSLSLRAVFLAGAVTGRSGVGEWAEGATSELPPSTDDRPSKLADVAADAVSACRSLAASMMVLVKGGEEEHINPLDPTDFHSTCDISKGFPIFPPQIVEQLLDMHTNSELSLYRGMRILTYIIFCNEESISSALI